MKKNYEVYWVANKSTYQCEIKSVGFDSKENADMFIYLLKKEGYELSNAFGGYMG